MRGQHHVPAAFYPRARPGTHSTGGWVGPRAGLDVGKSRPTGIRSPDRPANSQSLYRLSYPAHLRSWFRSLNQVIHLMKVHNVCVCVCVCVYIYIYIYMCMYYTCIYTVCNRRNGPDFGRVFLMLNYTEKPQKTYIQSSMVTEI